MEVAGKVEMKSSDNFRNKFDVREIDASYDFCRDVACREAGNFYWSFRLLPADRRRAMCALYAFMRQTDDIADEGVGGSDRAEALNLWQSAFHQGVQGELPTAFSWPGFPALIETVKKYNIPAKYLDAVIKGVRYDLNPVRVQTDAEFRDYCWHVASAVGLCCLHIWGFQSNNGRAETLAETLGIAFQRTNILRDISEDYARNRVYLPAEWLDKYNIHPNEFALPTSTENLKRLVREQVVVARSEYDAARELQSLVNPEGRAMLRAIARIYEGILDLIENQDYDVLVERARVPRWRKMAIMLGSIVC